jgi:hypothetical protein
VERVVTVKIDNPGLNRADGTQLTAEPTLARETGPVEGGIDQLLRELPCAAYRPIADTAGRP